MSKFLKLINFKFDLFFRALDLLYEREVAEKQQLNKLTNR